MKLRRMVIKNFRCYKGEQEIEFDLDGKITLIYGLSGAGKSSFVQFIQWMFYDTFPKNKSSEIVNKPLYNEVLAEELANNSHFEVFGKIEFENDGKEYILTKKNLFKKYINRIENYGFTKKLLMKKDNGSWIEFTGNLKEKINDFAPEALSKYFFFSGEENILKESSAELKTAIYNLFGISKYENALNHLGDRTTPNTVINKYSKQLIASKPKEAKERASFYLSKATEYKIQYEKYKKKYEDTNKRLDLIDKEIDKTNIELAKNSIDPEEKSKNLKRNRELIKSYKEKIKTNKATISKYMYSSAPYLVMTDKVKQTELILETSAKNERTFEGLQKVTLEDILRQGICLCGTELTEKERVHIKKIIESMPPNSYNYTYNQFVKKNLKSVKSANDMYEKINDLIMNISEYTVKINSLEEENRIIILELQRSGGEHEKLLAENLVALKKEQTDLRTKQNDYYRAYQSYNVNYKKNDDLYNKVIRYEIDKDDYDTKINILNNVRNALAAKKQKEVENVTHCLEESIEEVFNQISSRTLDFNAQKFLKDDFSMCEGYLTGGQETINVYAYIIGMIKAIHNVEEADNSSEFPIVIDAPFSKTDNEQVQNVISVIPEIVSQVVMCTFDIDKIRKADTSKIGSVWIVTGDTDQRVSTIRRGGSIYDI